MTLLKDQALIQTITARLSADFRTGGQTIDVQVSNGEITLVGMCDTDEGRAVAEMIALGVCGVRRVISEIEVRRIASAI